MLLHEFDPKQITEVHSAVGLTPVYEVVYQGECFAFYQSYVGEPKCIGDYEDITLHRLYIPRRIVCDNRQNALPSCLQIRILYT